MISSKPKPAFSTSFLVILLERFVVIKNKLKKVKGRRLAKTGQNLPIFDLRQNCNAGLASFAHNLQHFKIAENNKRLINIYYFNFYIYI
ncbi:hypothetical protein ASG14_09040 [Pedobacter sp. Leaf194]|nr:hypothetical protein ASG14_09040 [Pedobacter sp. Leaf194]